MANEVIGIEVAVKLDQLRAQLATLGPGMEKEAAAMTAALNKQLKAQTAAVKQQTAAMTAAQRSGVKALGNDAAMAGTQFDKLGKAMGPLGGVLSKISPEAGAAASSVAGLTSAFEGVTAAGVAMSTAVPVLLAISAAVAAGAVAWELYNLRVDRAKAVSAQRAGFYAAEAQFIQDINAATYDLAKTTGTLTEAEAKDHMRREVGAQLRKESAGLTTDQAADLRSLAGDLINVRDEEIEYEFALAKSNDQLERRTKATAAASKAAKEAAEVAKVLRQDEDAAQSAKFKVADAATAQAIEHAESEAAKRLEATKEAIRNEKAERAAKAETEEQDETFADAQRKRDDQTVQDAVAVTDAVMALGNQLLQNEIDNLDTSTKEGRKTAMDLWHVQQGLAIARAALDAVAAISAASTLVPPASYVAMAVAGITGAINIAAVAGSPPPKFHAGGLSPDEGSVTMRRGEAMLSGQGRRALGDDTIREANAGRGDSGSGAQRGQIVYKHRAFEYFVADHLNMNGTLAKTIRKGDRVGQLRRGRA